MFGPDDEEKSDCEKRVEEDEEKEKEEDGVTKESQSQIKVKDDERIRIEEGKDKGSVEKEEKKELKLDKKEEKEVKGTKEDKVAVAKEPNVPEVVKGQITGISEGAEEPMAVSDTEECLKEPPTKTQTETKSKDVGETNNKNKKTEPSKATVTENDHSLDDIDNLLKIEQECATLQDLVAKQSETGSDVEQDLELEKEGEEEMEVDLEVELQVKENEEDKTRTEQEIEEPEKTENEKVKLDNNDMKKDVEMKADEPSVVVMADLTADDLDDEPLVIDESVNQTTDVLEAPSSIKQNNENVNDDSKDTDNSPPLDGTKVELGESKEVVLDADSVSFVEKPKEVSTIEEMSSPVKKEEQEVASREVKPEGPKQKVETMSELIRTLTSDSEPVKAVNPLVIAPVNDIKKEEHDSAATPSCMQTITPLASLQAVLTATQKSLPTTTTADARLFQAGIQVTELMLDSYLYHGATIIAISARVKRSLLYTKG